MSVKITHGLLRAPIAAGPPVCLLWRPSLVLGRAGAWPAPSARGLVNRLISLRQRIRSQGEPWPRWRSARPGPHKTLRVAVPYFTQQVSRTPIDCQAISLPPPADLVSPSRRVSAPGRSLSYDAVAAFMLNFSPRRITAQAIRASLAASATTTVFTCARASRPRNHAPNGVSPLDNVGRAARAP